MEVNTQKYESGLIIFYDGWCRFCSGVIGWISRTRAGKNLNYLPIQNLEKSNFLKLEAVAISSINDEILVLNNYQLYKGVKGILIILSEMGGRYKLLARVLGVFPNAFLSGGYQFIAKHRYRIFGKNKQCAVL